MQCSGMPSFIYWVLAMSWMQFQGLGHSDDNDDVPVLAASHSSMGDRQ